MVYIVCTENDYTFIAVYILNYTRLFSEVIKYVSYLEPSEMEKNSTSSN